MLLVAAFGYLAYSARVAYRREGGATALFTTAYRPEERNKAQGAMDTCIFATMALTSFSSGALITTQGWTWLNLGSLLPIGAVSLALVWLGWHRAKLRARPA